MCDLNLQGMEVMQPKFRLYFATALADFQLSYGPFQASVSLAIKSQRHENIS